MRYHLSCVLPKKKLFSTEFRVEDSSRSTLQMDEDHATDNSTQNDPTTDDTTHNDPTEVFSSSKKSLIFSYT